ncbi:type IX secretion system outer membrane channel protein PorV [Salmonirosea aquatica]|uniref:Type IX secretion system outer membrane channel protein PorV n=1 Tax=Salmonirosea aquatica TaxID=2654236 RepID=A0A7C9F8N5_9BACT|nr:type IX secretion system outer membrane channel protein PorV [Cytophagaceae bacterium SJW1-29]
MNRLFVSLSSAFLLCGGFMTAQAQLVTGQDTTGRIPTTPLAFLNFSPDARSAALGDAGVALSPDANATYWNPAKLPYLKDDFGVSLSYTPWLRNLVDDMYFTYLTGYKKVAKGQVVALSVNYFDLGVLDFRNNVGANTGTFNSREFMVGATYGRQLGENFSVGLTLKYVNSNLAGSSIVNNISIRPASTAAGDISAYYKKEFNNEETGSNLTWSWGLMISNLGGKVSYGSSDKYFIPTNFKLGTGLSFTADGRNRFNFVLDANKLMVPTPPVYVIQNNQPVVVRGRDPRDLSTLGGIFGSFADAPDGFSEELKEIMISTGVEYWYNDVFAARFGYFSESRMKGDRKYFTVGFGARFQEKYGVDFAYLMPQRQGSPLAQTLRISLSMNLKKKDRTLLEEELEN